MHLEMHMHAPACPRAAGLASRAERRPTRLQCLSAAAPAGQTPPWVDEFTPLNDRQDVAPLPLPPVRHACHVTLVRHGQSTWNAEGRMQGSSDLSELTEKGLAQANKTRQLLSLWPFDSAFVSPLRRARQTAELVWQGRSGQPVLLPALREVDLYSLQGLTKSEAKATPQYAGWSRTPHLFELDGHAPVRELWFRASLAWESMLRGAGGSESASSAGQRHLLVVAHNAVNQALLGTAVGWGPDAFRRFEQSNAAYTTVTLVPGETPNSPAVATAGQLNITADGWAARAQPGALVLITAPEGGDAAANATQWSALLACIQSAPPVRTLACAPCELAQRLRSGLEQGGGRFPNMVLDGSAGVDSVLQQLGGQPSTADGITLVIAPAAYLERLLHQALLPAWGGNKNAFRLDAYGVSVLNPTAAGAPWPLVACVINDPLDNGLM